MKRIRIIKIMSDAGDQTLVNCKFELDYITDALNNAVTKCGRIFHEGEYEVLEGEQ